MVVHRKTKPILFHARTILLSGKPTIANDYVCHDFCKWISLLFLLQFGTREANNTDYYTGENFFTWYKTLQILMC
jgi:hypothetical protein